ncbi:Small acid-soluble spore protein, alpha/beta family, SASP_6 [Bacillus cereus]|nr:Small acid-soluble spore protein, alpha/beta family, SASP_6 [Bacillus cereus]
MANNNSGSRNELLVRGAEQALDQMKYEIAQEFGVQLGADATARSNGSVGGEITKRDHRYRLVIEPPRANR